jgi:splicing factor 3B subunit 1
MQLLLQIKSGTEMREDALLQIKIKAREFGAESIFSVILALLKSPILEDRDRHLLMKVIDHILYHILRPMDELVDPCVDMVRC